MVYQRQRKHAFAVALVLCLLIFTGIAFASPSIGEPVGTIRGGVYQDFNGDGVCDDDERRAAVPGMEIHFSAYDSQFVLHSGANGRYGRPGRIPGSVNVPAASQLEPATLEIRAPEAVARAFAAAGADQADRIILYCGGGIAATLDAFLLHQLGFDNLAVYDNSMSEWATDESLPMETD